MVKKRRPNFIRHNKKVWKKQRQATSGTQVLVEFNSSNPLIGFSYLANVIAKHFQSSIRPFVASPKSHSVLPRKLWLFLFRAGYFLGWIPEARLYKSFGARSNALTPDFSRDRALEADKICNKFFLSDPNKRDLESFTVKGVLIGDLIYDTFLRQESLPTVDLAHLGFRKLFFASVNDFLFWMDYVSAERVSAVITSHSVYNLAFPARAAIAKGIPAFVAGSHAMYRLTRERQHAGCEFLDYPEFFANMSEHQRDKLLADADETLEKRFEGSVEEGSDISVIGAASYRSKISNQALAQDAKTKILVALHAFSDSPHWGGRALFPDYWEWVKYLAEWSLKSDYGWYLKVHPDAVHYGDLPTVKKLLGRFPHLNLLNDSVSHHQLIEEGISAVLTVHGTIGFEYALLGIPVVNASRVNPHIRYAFNYHPQTVGELDDLLGNLHNLQKPTERDREMARQYFAIKNHLSKKKFLVGHPVDLPSKATFRRPAAAKRVQNLRRFVEMFDHRRHTEHVKTITSFVESDKYYLK